jgi:hypothetical protein
MSKKKREDSFKNGEVFEERLKVVLILVSVV